MKMIINGATIFSKTDSQSKYSAENSGRQNFQLKMNILEASGLALDLEDQ